MPYDRGGRVCVPRDRSVSIGSDQQAPLSAQTSHWPLCVAGDSFCVHHFAVYLCPFWLAWLPVVYTAVALQAGTVHVPGLLVVGLVVGIVVGGVAPANRAVYFVNSHAVCGTLLHVPDVVLWFGSAHCRSRLTDQYVYRASPWLVA
jgi:hypothetical protein